MVSDITKLRSDMNVCVQNLRAVFEDQETRIKMLETRLESTVQKTYANVVLTPQKKMAEVLGKLSDRPD